MTIRKTKKFLLALLICTLACTNVARAGEDRLEVPLNTENTAISKKTFENLPGGDQSLTEGGAIENHGTDTSITGSTFTKNSARQGGAVYNSSNGSISIISGSKFTENTTTQEGGAIYNDGTITTIGSDNVTDSSDTIFEKNSAGSEGGAIFNKGTISKISDSTFTENTAGANGGAICNGTTGGVSLGVTITIISGCTFTNNTANGGGTIVGGGAISNDGIITSIENTVFKGNVANNTSTESYHYSEGGAIYNYYGNIGTISGCTFEENGTGTDSKGTTITTQYGGAIYNEDSGNNGISSIENTTFTSNTSSSSGGAIYNSGTITSITGTLQSDGNSTTIFAKNTSRNGGAIYNSSSASIGEISGCEFTKNSSGNDGGGIFNSGTITTIDNVIFTSNEAGSWGGAIRNNTDGTISKISNSTFTSNTAVDAGGAIYNYNGTIGIISGCTFTENIASGGSSNVDGGAIYNNSSASIGEISGCTFTGNTASSNGGAIYNSGTITTIKNTSFTNNSASSDGGAIYSTKDLTIAADGSATDGSGDVVFSGNTAGGSGDAIYMNGANTTLTFSLTNKGTITLEDSIDGNSSGYSVSISGDNSDTTFYLLADIGNAALSVGDSYGKLTLNTIDNEIHEYKLNSFAVAGNFNMAVDVDLAGETMDRISAADYGTAGGTLTVSSMNIFSETDKDCVAIYFADTGLMKSVVQASGLSVTAYSPIYKYSYSSNDVHYVYSDNGEIYYEGKSVGSAADTDLISDDGGYFVFGATETSGAGSDSQHHLGDYNPAVLASEVATAGVYRAMNMVLDYGFEHSDYFMKLPEEVRLAQIDQAKANKSASKVKENDPTKLTYYNQHELTYRGAWAKSFFSNDRVSFQDGFTSRDKYYGAMLGFDSNLKEHGDGWAHLFTGYVGTMGIRQDWGGGHIKQHGGFVGATASFYKKNFFTAWTAAAGMMKAHEHTMYGKDKERLDSYGIAGRFGWNIDMDYNGKFALLPTFTASYSTVNPENFTNSADVKFTGSGFRAVQLNPNVKFIWKMNDGWQPYLTVGEVWTVGESSHVTATYSGTRNNLTALDLRAYTEYGAGVQKRWANDRDAYIEFLGHSDGRDGFLVNAGIRWNF